MEYGAFSVPSPIEDGTISFVGNGMFMVSWKYKEHIICGIFHRDVKGLNMLDDPSPGISIYFGKTDVTCHYIETLNDDDTIKPRTTLDNLVSVTQIINENIEEYNEDGDFNSEC